MSKEKFLTVYKCKGYKPTFRSRLWYSENPDIGRSDDFDKILIEKNHEILDGKVEPYYSDLIKGAKVSGISKDQIPLLREMLTSLLEASKTMSFTREDIDKNSEHNKINLWQHLFWEQRLVRLKD